MVALGERALDFDAALRRLQSAVKLDEERVADGLDLRAVEPGEQRSQQGAMVLEQLLRELLVALGERAVAHHVGEHDGGQLALFGVFGGHRRIQPDCAGKETTDRPG